MIIIKFDIVLNLPIMITVPGVFGSEECDDCTPVTIE